MIPFGLTNVLITFMNMMNNIFQEYLYKFVMVFLDDIMIYSRNKEEHDYHLKLVLEVLRKHQLFGKLSKYEFYVS